MIKTQLKKQFGDEMLSPDELLNKTIDWISENLDPEDVFKDGDLSNWALRNGFVEEE